MLLIIDLARQTLRLPTAQSSFLIKQIETCLTFFGNTPPFALHDCNVQDATSLNTDDVFSTSVI